MPENIMYKLITHTHTHTHTQRERVCVKYTYGIRDVVVMIVW